MVYDKKEGAYYNTVSNRYSFSELKVCKFPWNPMANRN